MRFLYWDEYSSEEMNTEKKELTEVIGWVVVSGTEVYHFNTFEEALHSPYKGHVMSKYYYEYNYR